MLPAHRQPLAVAARKAVRGAVPDPALVVIGEVAGVVLGRAVRGAISSRVVRTVDSLIGVVLQIVVVLVAAWLLAAPLTSSDQPNLAAAVRGSKVLAEVDRRPGG